MNRPRFLRRAAAAVSAVLLAPPSAVRASTVDTVVLQVTYRPGIDLASARAATNAAIVNAAKAVAGVEDASIP